MEATYTPRGNTVSKTFSPAEFMSKVVAWPGPQDPGYINLHWHNPSGFFGRAFKDIDSFMRMAGQCQVHEAFKEVYFCLSTQNKAGRGSPPYAKRAAKEALWLKSIWIDVDVKPNAYADLEEALSAITKFIKDVDLPPPSAIVYSGGGVHLYWISDIPLTVNQWYPYAAGLRAELQRLGLKCDLGLTTDAARVLRIPGTNNNKLEGNPRKVELKWLGSMYNFAAEAKLSKLTKIKTLTVVNAPVMPALGPMADAFKGAIVENLADGIEKYENTLLRTEKVEVNCVHFRDCKATHGAKHSEPLWNLTLLAATFFEEGEKLAHEYSSAHPDYTKEATDKKYQTKVQAQKDKGLGWPSCVSFEQAGADCKSCPHYGKLKSPLNLADRVTPVTPFSYSSNVIALNHLDLPPGFYMDDNNWICERVKKKNFKTGETYEDGVRLFMSELRNPVAQGGSRRAFLCETSLDNGKWGSVEIEEALLYSDLALLKQLRACGVKTNVPNEARIRNFMTCWMAKLDAAKNRIDTVPYGWLRDGDEGQGKEIGFAYGGTVFMCDGTEQRAGYADRQLEEFYRPRGKVEVWRTALKIFTDQKRPALEAIICMSLASPLLQMTGKNNCVGNGWSGPSGRGKTSSQIVGLAIWGNPRLTKENPQSSPKGIIKKLGILRHLPVYWDEIADDEKMSAVRKMLNSLTEGAGPSLLQQNRDFHVKADWQCLMMLGSNRSLLQNIFQAEGTTDAQAQRVFEFYVDDPENSTLRESDVSILLASLEYNYGQIGLAYAKYLGQNAPKVREHVKQVLDTFADSVNQRTAERFRAAMAACIYVGAEIANVELGCSFNLKELWDFLRLEFLKQRAMIDKANIIGGTFDNTLSILTQFFKDNSVETLWVKNTPIPIGRGRPAQAIYIAGPCRERPGPVHIRMAVSDQHIDISKKQLQDFLVGIKGNAAVTIKGIQDFFKGKEIKDVNLATGAGVIGGKEVVIRIPVTGPDSPFWEDLHRHTPFEERPQVELQQAELTEPKPEDVTAALTELSKLPKALAPLPPKEVLPSPVQTAMTQALRDAKTQ